ncbi:MAG: noncanonical pyrimidine nucleotidase, YjjG family [Bacteroidetes bacterium 4572_112]|nr:MAG: noncanonical pyrimidine nucleotidase, YjjG family [Bacteroidetes bacterium 4572_112]
MKYKHLFFDLDRTLWNFEANSEEVLEDMFNKFDITTLACIDSQEFIDNYREINHGLWAKYRVGEITKEFLSTERFHATLRLFDVDNFGLAKKMGEFYVKESPYKKQLFPGTIELLEKLSNKYKLHIITNGFSEVQYIKLEQSKLSKYFTEIIISEETDWKKPSPEIFHYAMQKAGAIVEESIMIGDDLKADIKGASEVGMDQIWVNFDNTYAGFKPTYTVDSLMQIEEIL